MLMHTGAKVYLYSVPVDGRLGFTGLALKVQETLKQDPFGGACFVFRNRKANRLKALWWDGTGLSLYCKRLESGKFAWPMADASVLKLSSTELALLIDGMDWRRLMLPRTRVPIAAG